jgi:hypothetical protein
MKIFISKLLLWLPLAFLILTLVDMFFLERYIFKTRYGVLFTPALVGLTISYIAAAISEAVNNKSVTGVRYIYKWHAALPLAIILIMITLASMNR